MQAVLGSPEGGKQVVIRCSESAMKISGRAREGLMTGPCPPAAKHAGEGGKMRSVGGEQKEQESERHSGRCREQRGRCGLRYDSQSLLSMIKRLRKAFSQGNTIHHTDDAHPGATGIS